MVAKTKAKKTVRKVVKGLKKASKSHAKQAKTLASLKLKKGGPAKKSKSRVNEAGNYTKPNMRKKIFQRIKSQASHGTGAGQWSA